MAGTIMMKELGTVIKLLGQHLTEAELRNMVEEVDANGSGANADGSSAIDFNMFLSLVARQMCGGADAEEELREAFQVFDKEINGFIPLDELCHVMKKLGEKFSEDELNEMLHEAGVNADGQINYKEFAKVMLAN